MGRATDEAYTKLEDATTEEQLVDAINNFVNSFNAFTEVEAQLLLDGIEFSYYMLEQYRTFRE